MTVLRPRTEFPTPLFRLFCGWFAGCACAAPGAYIVSHLNEAHTGYYLGLAAAALAGGPLALRLGNTGPRLAWATIGAIALVVGALAVELLVFFSTYTFE